MTLKILIADDHEIFRRGLAALIQSRPGWEVCAAATDGLQAVDLARQHKPQVAVLDMSMPRLNGLEAARRIRKELPKTQVVMLTMHESEELAREVLDAGVLGYILKSDADRDLLSAIEAVSRKKPFFTATVSQAVLEGFLNPRPRKEKAGGRLSPREREIVQLLCEGKTSKEVAAILNISTHTAETHRTNIMRKLQLGSFSELVRYAIRNKMVVP
jgi:DNA-binding NarL/FixJ family response regulator